ncbi:MAG: SLBB domain-containing protein [Candidatus Poribacteria bacterium]|nr:SLBB domain-containing protein [Candidatus Poribacteria bacterium]
MIRKYLGITFVFFFVFLLRPLGQNDDNLDPYSQFKEFFPKLEPGQSPPVQEQEQEQIDSKDAEDLDQPKTEIEEDKTIEKEVTEEEVEEKDKRDLLLKPEGAKSQRFGYHYFEGARKRILALESSLQRKGVPQSQIQDAISGFVGPIEMIQGNVNALVPHNRILRPGDNLSLISWSDQTPLSRRQMIVDSQGYVVLPEVGKLVVRGMTLARFEEVAQEALSRKQFTDLQVIVTLSELHTIQVFITGWVFRPGSYATSSVTTLFNALYLSGGPSEDGALREIRLLRNGETTTVDFYKYLMEGDSSQDIPLLPGDTIYIAPVNKLVDVAGEVRRPGIYEMSPDENFEDLLKMAGGVQPTGFAKRIQIDTVLPNQERILREVQLSIDQNPPVYNGDKVQVLPIRDEVLNIVHLEGLVKRPDIYELKQGMSISDLIQRAEGLKGEAHLERADLFRLNEDEKTTTLIPLNLEKALAEDKVHNLQLKQRDRLVVYSKFEVQWYPDRIVSVQGAITKSGRYERSSQMRISDLLVQAGGIDPTAHLPEATLFRLNKRQQVAIAIPINLELVLQKVENHDVLLTDGDTLLIHRFDEVEWSADREVSISGHVQQPGVYPRVDEMPVSDLLFHAGGLLPNADDIALLLRRNQDWIVTESLEFNLNDLSQTSLILKDGDNLIVYTKNERKWQAPRDVTISGAVQRPGIYERVDEMRVSDLLFRAGGVLPNAYLDRVNLQRFLPDQERTQLITVNLQQIHDGIDEADLLLQDRDRLIISTFHEVSYYPEPIVTIYGAVQLPGEYDYQENMKLADLLFLAGGVLPNARNTAEVARAFGADQTQIIEVDLVKLSEGDENLNVVLNSRDVVTIPSQQNFREDPVMVTISGQVQYPGVYTIQQQDRLSDLILRAGGLTDHAFPAGAVFTRKEEKLIDLTQLAALERTIKQIEAEKEYEYIRELAKSQQATQQGDVAEGLEETVTSMAQFATAPATAPLAAAGQIGNLAQNLNLGQEQVSDQNPASIERQQPVPVVPLKYRDLTTTTISEIDVESRERLAVEEEPNQTSGEEEGAIDQSLTDNETSLKKKIQATGAQTLSGLKTDQDIVESAIPTDEIIRTPEETAQVGVHLVTPARKIEATIPGQRILIDLPEILEKPHTGIDPLLEDQDEIYIPQVRQTVVVTGGVLHPSSFIYQEKFKMKDYIEMAGGFAKDADDGEVYVLKASGLAYRGKKVDQIDYGDIIVVPTQVMVERINDRWEQIFGVVRLTLVTVTTAYLIGQFTSR